MLGSDMSEPEPDEQPDDEDEVPADPPGQLTVVPKPKGGITSVLPRAPRQRLEDLANPTGVSVLVGLVDEEKYDNQELRLENQDLRRQAEALTSAVATLDKANAVLQERAKQRAKHKIVVPIITTSAGLLLRGPWSGASAAPGLIIMGFALLGLAIFIEFKT